MNLKIGIANGRKYLSISHGYRDPVTKKSKAKNIKSLGYLDELEKTYPDPIAHFKQVVAEMNAKQAEEKAFLNMKINPNAQLDGVVRKNLGYSALSKIYHSLGLSVFFTNNSRSSKAEYNVNNIMKTEVFSRILFPGSKKKTYENREVFFEDTNYSLEDVYRCLAFVNGLDAKIQRHIHTKVKEKYGRNTDLVYYDVTNYYFEIDHVDQLRKKGVNKKHRPDSIVQMGLFMDTDGIPISYRLFAGNTNDCETLYPFLREVKRDFDDIGRVIVVADKGLNTSPNITKNIFSKDGYVFSQKIRGANKELQTYVLDQSNYVCVGEEHKIKSRVYPRTIYVKDINGTKKQVEVDEKQVVFYSKKYAEKARAEREAVIQKAYDLVNNPSKYNKTTSYGAAKYVKNIEFDPKTGEILTVKNKPIFDDEKLKDDEKWDGYYAIVTSELNKSDSEIIEIYRGLWKIEETFKVTKSDFETRPIYLSRQDRINAHFLICFIALVVTRILENQLGNQYSINKIAESLRKVCCSPLEENWYLLDYADQVTAAIKEKMGIDLCKKYLKLAEIKNILAKTKK